MQRYKKFKALPNFFEKKARKKARFRFSCKTTRKTGHFVIMSFVIKSVFFVLSDEIIFIPL